MIEFTKPITVTKRMKQLLEMLATGASNGEIAEKLIVSEHTVKVHMWRMYKRLGVNSRGAAVAWWLKTNGNTETIEQAFERGRQAGRMEILESLAALPKAASLTPATK